MESNKMNKVGIGQFIKKHIKMLLGLVGIIILFNLVKIGIAFYPYVNIKPVTNAQLDELDLSRYHKVMIVAHPDDELIWGGGHLIEDDYLVICITNGNNAVRSKEFDNVIKATNDKGLILSYPDKIIGRSKWKLWKGAIQKDIETILNYKKWDEVVTHNENGEYGHNQHVLTYELTKKAYEKAGCDARLFCFGKYYRANALPDDLQQIDSETVRQKKQIAKCYYSQKRTIRKFYHMIPYELWTEEPQKTPFS